jgi:glycosyltransferase involved in cell wall biosynthesis
MSEPDVSVVMAVHNGGRYLASSVESVLRQEEVSVEFIIVDDGSTDTSPALIQQYAAQDNRLRVIRQENRGLTQALARGCRAARGIYIARQDADDASLPGRLGRQVSLLSSRSDVSLVGCWTRLIGPEEEELGTWTPPSDSQTATTSLRERDPNKFRSLGGHGSAMFRRVDYVRCGGYRPEFYYAQDLDLWLRLTEIGSLSLVPEILYTWRFTPASITGRSRAMQRRMTRLILEATRRRGLGLSEDPILEEAKYVRPPSAMWREAQSSESAGLYFIGKCLLSRRDERSVGYLRRAVRSRPWHVKSWIALILASRIPRD